MRPDVLPGRKPLRDWHHFSMYVEEEVSNVY
jgi:hypothetical protein